VKQGGLTVSKVLDDGIAQEMGLEQGDSLVSINGHRVIDVLDYYFYSKDYFIDIVLKKANGESWQLEIEKDYDQDLGVEFSSTGLEKINRCVNKCLFCFVDQMPEGMRETLYIKDDDYRLSFLQGSFITLTNATEKDLKRIAGLRLSPLYVSVHATNPDLRKKIMGSPRASEIVRQLEYLTSNGIEVHTQAVLCPGINDGAEMDRTVSDLVQLWPGVKSLAVVPVGLTGSREGLFPIKKFTREEALVTVRKVKAWQDRCLKDFNYPFVFASDEFYLLAGTNIPARSRYGDFPQTENGVGLTRLFLDQWSRVKKSIPPRSASPIKVLLVTGLLGEIVLQPVLTYLNSIENLKVGALAIKNSFFGEMVTVSGLLTGNDILKEMARIKSYDLIILPSSVLKKDSGVMLDGISPEEIEALAGVPVRVAEGPFELAEIIKKVMGEF